MFLKKFALTAIVLVAGTSSIQAQDNQDKVMAQETISWNGELAPDYFWKTTDVGVAAIAKAQAVSNANESKGCYKLGNLAFIETVKNANHPDLPNILTYYAATIGEKSSEIFQLPNDMLLAKYVDALRKSPNAIPQSTILDTMMLLAIGSRNYIKRENNAWVGEEVKDPTWTDKDGVLTLVYFVAKAEWMQMPHAVKCTLTLNNNIKSIICEE